MTVAAVQSAYPPVPPEALGIQPGQAAPGDREDAQLRRVCHEFESVLFSCMLTSMRQTVEKSDLFSGGRAEEIYTSLLDQEYARSLSGSVSGGIADALYKQIAPVGKDGTAEGAAGHDINIRF